MIREAPDRVIPFVYTDRKRILFSRLFLQTRLRRRERVRQTDAPGVRSCGIRQRGTVGEQEGREPTVRRSM